MTTPSLPVLASAAQIQTTLKRELVPVEEWGYCVWVSELTAGKLDEYRTPMYVFDSDAGKMHLNMAEQGLRLVTLSMQDEHGNEIYPDVEAGIEDLKSKGSAGVEVVAKVARRLSGLGDDAKQLEGNSGAGKTGASRSA